VKVTPLTSADILSEVQPARHAMRSRYIRVAQALEWYPWKRAKLYSLISSGRIRSFVLKERGALRGLRLIDRDSLDHYLQAAAEQAQAQEASARFHVEANAEL
jgi:hypothetical protein